LNGGDAGLKRFFERVYATLVPGGTFVLEAQPRESYVKARKLHPVRVPCYLPSVLKFDFNVTPPT
jgi:7SK snRNA methylphosphate capping enzyme